MQRFSEREGFKPVRSTLQIERMDAELRNRLWNLVIVFFEMVHRDFEWHEWRIKRDSKTNAFLLSLWHNLLKLPIDSIDLYWPNTLKAIRGRFFRRKWYEVYDFVEFVANEFPYADPKAVANDCNLVLEQELSGYRFVGGRIVPITSEEEITAIEEALEAKDVLGPVSEHLRAALSLMADRETPDYRNSIKESISAVEAACKILTGNEKAALGPCLKQMGIHRALTTAFSSLYGYTSNADGIRHALLEESNLTLDDAKFMLVACSAFVNYLKVKWPTVGKKS